MTTELTLIATIKVLPGHAEAVAAGLRQLVIASRAEPGCLQYALHRSEIDTSQFVMIERWRDAEALELHRATPHFLLLTHDFGERLAGIDLLPLQRLA
ncbi:putative quinol monooxygenase [Aeromonas dhakensis]|uniref:putative quinol monooxygenase n=1 Tax=Aeromonas dhakensis TaxID=196024 RepID=UPI00357163E4